MVRSMRAACYGLLLDALAALTPATACRLGAALGQVVFTLGLRRRVASANVFQALGLRGPARRRAVQRSYGNMAATFLEIWTLRATVPVAEIANPQWFAHLIAQGRPLVFLTGHIGNWDAAAAYGATKLQPLFVYAKAQHDATLDARLGAVRAALGMTVVFARHGDRRGALQILRGLRPGGGLGVMADQMPKRNEGCPGYFAAAATDLHLGPAVLARRLQAELVPMVCLRRGPGRNVLVIGRPVPAHADDAVMTQRGMDALAGAIRAFPGQYFWQHRRFKRPVELPPRAEQPWRHGLRALLAGGHIP